MKFKTILVVLFAAVVAVFSIQNIAITEVNFLYWKTSTPLVIVVLGSFILGVIIGLLVSIKKTIFRKDKTKILEKVNKEPFTTK